jgi:hypothetical protein
MLYRSGCHLIFNLCSPGVQKSEKALGAMPKGPFIAGNCQFFNCADFENVHGLSI